jgi:twitching motility protein PilI
VQGQSETAPAGAEWVGIAFRLGGEGFLLAREETREVMAYPTVVTRVPGAKLWIRGLSNVRGQLLPIVDLRAFLGSGTTNVTRATRVLIANHREISRVSSPTRPGFRGLPRASLQPSCRRR